MNYIVTGGAGFIGGNFVHYMLDAHPNDKIICFDALTYAGNMETINSALTNPNFKFIKGDITDQKAVNSLFAEEAPDYVINFAAETHVDRSIENPSTFLLTNVIGTQVLMDACRTYGVKRFHQISTDEVYGDLPLNRPDLHFTEETPIKTSSPYSASKAAADLLALAYCRTYQLNVTISRCSNNYGEYQHPEKLIPLAIRNALSNQFIPVYAKGENVRDWLYVTDHCKAVDLILHNGTAGEIYNIGGHSEMKNIDVVTMILDFLNQPHSLIKHVKNRPGHDLRYAIDPSKIQAELGWKADTSFINGLKHTVAWYVSNQVWLETIIKKSEARI